MNITKRIGFACKWIDNESQVDGIGPKDDARQYNTGATTITWLDRQPRAVAEQKLWDLCNQNIEATRKLVEKVGTLNDSLRMVRLSSDILPAFTHRNYRDYYSQPDIRRHLEANLARVGDIGRSNKVRLSMHPGQFCVLASDNSDTVDQSIEEFEYHATMAAWMGYGRSFQDFKINVHIAGRAGVSGIREAYKRLSPEARNTITIENEEISYGLTNCLELADTLPIVLDIHHHWIREGEYIQPNDSRVQRVIDSWRGVRPTCHYSVSREDVLVDHDTQNMPDHKLLLESGHKKQKLRAHSNFYWNEPVNKWALGFTDQFDIMCESKAKNLASFKLYEYAKQQGIL